MPLEIITDALPAAASLALLLNPTREFGRIPQGLTGAPVAVESVEGDTDHLLGGWGGARRNWGAHGFDFTVQYIGEVQANVSGGNKRGTVYNGLLIASVDLDLNKLTGWPGAKLHGGMLFPHGRSLTENYAGDLFVASNLDASDSPRLFELWLEQSFAHDTLSLRLGQIAVDQEFAGTERGGLFGSSAFGWFPIAGLNVPSPIYPQGGPGVRLAWHPQENFFVQAAVFDGNVDPLNATGEETNPNGINFRFDEGAFSIAETGFSWEQLCAGDKKNGSLKFGGWYHTAEFAHQRFDNGGLSLGHPLSSGAARQLRGNWGVYGVLDQTVWHEPTDQKDSAQGAGIFARLGYAPADRNTLQAYGEFGVTYTGLLSTRDADVFGVGIAYGQMSDQLRSLGGDLNFVNRTSAPLPDHEIAIELAYQCHVLTGWTLQPSLQVIIHPGGSAAIPDALLVGLRSTFDF